MNHRGVYFEHDCIIMIAVIDRLIESAHEKLAKIHILDEEIHAIDDEIQASLTRSEQCLKDYYADIERQNKEIEDYIAYLEEHPEEDILIDDLDEEEEETSDDSL